MSRQYHTTLLPEQNDGEQGTFIHIDTELFRPGQVAQAVGDILVRNLARSQC